MKKGQTTLKDIATKLNVSATTVSLVLNGSYQKRRISEELAETIRHQAQLMGYIPNFNAQLIRKGKRQVTIAIMSSFEAPINLIGSLSRAIDDYIRHIDDPTCEYSLIMDNFHAGHLAESPAMLGKNRFHGAIISNTRPEDDAFLASHKTPFPAVLIGRKIDGYSSLLSDQYCGGDLAADVLFDAGCRHLAILRPEHLTQTTYSRVDSFCRLVEEKGLPTPWQIIGNKMDEKSGFDAMTNVLSNCREIDGLFAISDVMAIGAYHAIKKVGLRIPQDICVMGSDNMSFCPYMDPPLTSISVKRDQHLSESARILIGTINGEISTPVEIRISSNVIERESTRK